MIAENTARRKGLGAVLSAAVGINPRAALFRQVLASLLVLVFTAAAFGDLCAGWSSNAADRAACCARLANHCASWAPDDCCEKGEQRRTRDLVRAVPLPAQDMTPGPLVAPIAAPATDLHLQVLAERPHAHLLHAVFLI